jgi:hypothetical protein
MRSEPFYLDRPVFEDDTHDQPVSVSHDFEYHSVVSQDARVPIGLFQLVEVGTPEETYRKSREMVTDNQTAMAWKVRGIAVRY